MPLSEGQIQLRDLVMGSGTSLPLATTFNPFTRTARADQSGPRAWNDGAWSGAEWTDAVVIPIRMYMHGTDAASWLALQRDLAEAFAPSHEDLELRFMLAGTEYVMFGRPRLVDPDARRLDGGGYVQAAFVALNPHIYAAAESTQVLGLPQSTGGLTVPITVPITITSTTTAGRAVIANNGRAPSPMVFRVDGPVSQPRVSLLQNAVNTMLQINLTLTTGQWLDIDTARRTVYLNGTASRRGYAAGGWPMIEPGSAELAFDAATYEASAQLTASWRDAWH